LKTHRRPIIVYNFYVPFYFTLLCAMFYKIIDSPSILRLRWLFIAVIFLSTILSCAFFNIYEEYFKFPYYLSSSLLLILVFTYLKEIIKADKFMDIFHLRYFWISLGLLLFFVPFMPLFFCVDYLGKYEYIYFSTLLALNIIMHFFFNFGLIWTRKTI
jgi:hypothetical protein